MTRTRSTTWLLRAADAIALVALLASIAVVGQRLTADGKTRAPAKAQAPAPAASASGDRDGDGVPDAQDLAPDSPAPQQTPAAQTPATKLPPLDDCRRKGVTRGQGKEGSCYEQSGRRVRVVDKGSTLHLDELDARLLSIRVRDRRQERQADVTLQLELRNNLDGLVDVQASHFALLLGRGVYAPNLLATAKGANSLFRRGIGLGAGERVTGAVTFSVSRRAARRLGSNGNVEILQFSDTSLGKASLTVGVFRTYR